MLKLNLPLSLLTGTKAALVHCSNSRIQKEMSMTNQSREGKIGLCVRRINEWKTQQRQRKNERKHRWGVWEHFVICTSKDFISVLFWCSLMISKLSSWVHSALTSLSKAHNPPQSLCAWYNSNYCKHGYTFVHTFENNHIKSVECDRKRNTHTRWNQHICFDTICLTLCLSPSTVSFNYTMQILTDAYTHMHHSIIHSEGGQAWSGSEAEMSLLQLKNRTDTTKAKSVFKLASTAGACPQRRINRLRSRQSADREYFQT